MACISGRYLFQKETGSQARSTTLNIHTLFSEVRIFCFSKDHGCQFMQAPGIGITTPGTRRVLYALEDTSWATFHPNPTNERDLEKIEEFVILKIPYLRSCLRREKVWRIVITWEDFYEIWATKRDCRFRLVGTAAAGYIGSRKTAKGNEALAAQAQGDELARRKAAGAEAEKAIAAYNQLREERPGLTFREWANERVQALNDPALKEAFRKTKREDFEEAQLIANLASQGNVNTFEMVIDRFLAVRLLTFLRRGMILH